MDFKVKKPAKNETLESTLPARRKIDPAKKTAVDLKITPESLTVENCLQDAMSIIATDLARYKAKVSVRGSLDLKEARAVTAYVKAMIDLKREMREQERADDLSKLSEDELMALANKFATASRTIEVKPDQDEDEDED